jgi:hypothetical protein
MLGMISDEERQNRRWMAALYFGCTPAPTPLNFEEAEACMHGSNEEMLIALGKALAVKLDRDPEQIQTVVWKTPRMVGMHRGPLSTNGKFIILRRNPHNVFESQFRVGFGNNNRYPYRFAFFRESYENAFARLPKFRCFELQYDDLPGILPELLEFIGVEGQGDWSGIKSSLDLAAENCSWLTEVTKEFHNRDIEKRARLDPIQLKTLDRAMRLVRPARFLLGPTRAYFDHRSLSWSRNKAAEVLQAETHGMQHSCGDKSTE